MSVYAKWIEGVKDGDKVQGIDFGTNQLAVDQVPPGLTEEEVQNLTIVYSAQVSELLGAVIREIDALQAAAAVDGIRRCVTIEAGTLLTVLKEPARLLLRGLLKQSN